MFVMMFDMPPAVPATEHTAFPSRYQVVPVGSTSTPYVWNPPEGSNPGFTTHCPPLPECCVRYNRDGLSL